MKKILLGSMGCLAISMAFYAGLWTWLCKETGMLSWIGFAGCTTYFACGKSNLQGIGAALISNVSGVMWALISIVLGKIWSWSYGTVFVCAFISYMIIMQAKIEVLKFIPGAYIGCFVTFAAEGEWQKIFPAVVLGVLLGWITDNTGNRLYRQIHTAETEEL
ncbi:MAG: DUF1097 domain-containing protein [Hespellia sp.]|nr:DUF1097 domain-containing protein [Hespellia sp.]